MLEGHDERHIKEAVAAQFPELDSSTALADIMDHFARLAHADPDVIKGFCLDAYRELYRRMVSIGDYANAARVIKELEKLT